MCASVNFLTVNARVLKFHVCIPHEKIVDPYFFHIRVLPLFENLVCKISKKVFELDPSYLVYWLGLRSR